MSFEIFISLIIQLLYFGLNRMVPVRLVSITMLLSLLFSLTFISFPTAVQGVCIPLTTQSRTETLWFTVVTHDHEYISQSKIIAERSGGGCYSGHFELGHRIVQSQGSNNSLIAFAPKALALYTGAGDIYPGPSPYYQWQSFDVYEFSTESDYEGEKNTIPLAFDEFEGYKFHKLQHKYAIFVNEPGTSYQRRTTTNFTVLIYDIHELTTQFFLFNVSSWSEWQISNVHYDWITDEIYLLLMSSIDPENGSRITLRNEDINMRFTEELHIQANQVFGRNSIDHNLVFHDKREGEIYAYDPISREELWSWETGVNVELREIYNFGQIIYVSFSNGTVVEFDDFAEIGREYLPNLITMNQEARLFLTDDAYIHINYGNFMIGVLGVSIIIAVLIVKRRRTPF